MSVAVVTDSTAYLPRELVAAAATPLTIVPLHVVVGSLDRRESDVEPDDLAAALRSFTPVSTSRPTPQAFLGAYEQLAAEGATSVVSVHLSADMSGTVQSAQLAAGQAPLPVTVVDARTLGMAMGYAVLSAAQAAGRGAGPEEVAAVARARAAASSVAFYVDTLEHLRRGGRIGAASALLGSALAIKPILTIREGAIEPLERVRTSSRALARLAALALEAAGRAPGVVDVAVQHLDGEARAQGLAQQLRADLPADRVGEVVVGQLGAVVGAHVGPGTVAVVVSPRP
ncbi:DegV family protein [Lapillicoccus jejuensis]|uniref:DegV family protein with EDD domain n=1 Tax=Lapillicoccus jejuensis TaxID=402171 RepID=A0A542DVD0_9MICO|nr:DegV family protein [Lapillicoccus jejuensis]TQJ07052.1 DegV family protein with EDD domain [Lapillicoccus jejuensis]